MLGGMDDTSIVTNNRAEVLLELVVEELYFLRFQFTHQNLKEDWERRRWTHMHDNIEMLRKRAGLPDDFGSAFRGLNAET